MVSDGVRVRVTVRVRVRVTTRARISFTARARAGANCLTLRLASPPLLCCLQLVWGLRAGEDRVGSG